MKRMIVLLTIALFDLIQATDNPELKICYDNLKKYNIKAKPYTYAKIAKFGNVILYGNQFCQAESDQPKTYTCDRMRFNPRKNSSEPGLLELFLSFRNTSQMVSSRFDVYDTSIPGVFELYQQVTDLNARVMAFLKVKPGYIIIYLCSGDKWHYNDFRINTANSHPNEEKTRKELESYVTTPCHYFVTSQDNCPNMTIPY